MSVTTPLVMPPAVSVAIGVGTTAAGTDDSTAVWLADRSETDVVWNDSGRLSSDVDMSADGVERDEIGRNETEAENRDEENYADEREMADETAHINDDRTAIPPTDAGAVTGDARSRRAPAASQPAAAIDASSAGSRPTDTGSAVVPSVVTAPATPDLR